MMATLRVGVLLEFFTVMLDRAMDYFPMKNKLMSTLYITSNLFCFLKVGDEFPVRAFPRITPSFRHISKTDSRKSPENLQAVDHAD